MNKVIDIIAELDDGRRRLRERPEGIMVHRCGVDLKYNHVLGYDGLSVGRAFIGHDPKWEKVAAATGSENAYNFFIGGDLGPSIHEGVIWQALALDDIGQHARRFSARFLSIGLIADPRIQPISKMQHDSLVDLLFVLCPAFTFDPYRNIRGHGEVTEAHDGSKAPGKINACPGDRLNMNHVRNDADLFLQDAHSRSLYEAGIVFSSK